MIDVEQALFWAEMTALLLIGYSVVQIAVYGLRALRSGVPGLRVAVQLTASTIGMAVALGGSWLGSLIIFSALAPTDVSVLHLLGAQVAGALMIAWLAAFIYAKWLAPTVVDWFSREEVPGHG